MFSHAEEELIQLKNSIARYRERAKVHSENRARMAPAALCASWNEITEDLRWIAEREQGKDHANKTVRTCCTTITENISAFETWLSLLPSGDYGSVVSGVFKIAVEVSV